MANTMILSISGSPVNLGPLVSASRLATLSRCLRINPVFLCSRAECRVGSIIPYAEGINDLMQEKHGPSDDLAIIGSIASTAASDRNMLVVSDARRKHAGSRCTTPEFCHRDIIDRKPPPSPRHSPALVVSSYNCKDHVSMLMSAALQSIAGYPYT